MVTPTESLGTQPLDALFRDRESPGVLDQLVERFLQLAESLARRYQHSGQPLDDLVQVASIGLIKSIKRFDPDRGVNFESYAIPTILGELKRYHRDQGWSVRMPRRLQEHALVIKDAVPVLSQELGRSPSVAEVAAHSHLSEEEVLEAMDAQDAYASISLDAPLDDSGETSTLSDRLTLEDNDFEIADGWTEFVPHLRNLPERERRIIELRFFRDWTQSQIAEELGISQMHVSRLLSQTLRKLREALAASGGEPFS